MCEFKIGYSYPILFISPHLTCINILFSIYAHIWISHLFFVIYFFHNYLIIFNIFYLTYYLFIIFRHLHSYLEEYTQLSVIWTVTNYCLICLIFEDVFLIFEVREMATLGFGNSTGQNVVKGLTTRHQAVTVWLAINSTYLFTFHQNDDIYKNLPTIKIVAIESGHHRRAY